VKRENIAQLIFAVFLFSLNSSYALAEERCPDSSDLERGIVFEQELRNYTIKYSHQRIDIYEFWRGQDIPIFPDPYQMFQYRGLLTTLVKRRFAGGGQELVYDGLEDIFPLEVGSKKSIKRTTKDRTDSLNIEIKDRENYSIAHCSYEVFRIILHDALHMFNGKTKRVSTTIMYSPELSAVLNEVNYTAVRERKPSDWFYR